MNKWLSIELSLLLLVSLVAFAGFVNFSENEAADYSESLDNDLTGDLSFGFNRPRPQPTCATYGAFCIQSQSYAPFNKPKPAQCPSGTVSIGGVGSCRACCKQQDNNVVLVIDISAGGLGYELPLANKIVEQLSENTNLGVIAFNTQAYLVNPMTKLNAPLSVSNPPVSRLGSNSIIAPQKVDIMGKISRLYYFGGTLMSTGLLKATSMLAPLQGGKTIILISDGKTQDYDNTISAAKFAASKGIRIDAYGVGSNTLDSTMRQIAEIGKGNFKNDISGLQTTRKVTIFTPPQSFIPSPTPIIKRYQSVSFHCPGTPTPTPGVTVSEIKLGGLTSCKTESEWTAEVKAYCKIDDKTIFSYGFGSLC